MIIAIRAWPNSHSNINSRFVLMVFVAHFIRLLWTLTQMALVCKTVPGERNKVRSTVVLTVYQLNYLHWKILHGSLENLTATSSERKSRAVQVRVLVAQDEQTVPEQKIMAIHWWANLTEAHSCQPFSRHLGMTATSKRDIHLIRKSAWSKAY